MAILIVEDNPVSAKLMEHSLKRLNYETIIATKGSEALHILSEDASINLVITDMMMPDMDGLELMQELKTSSGYAHIPVIVCTVLRDKDSIKRAAMLGCSHYLVKPYQINDLRMKVADCLKKDKIFMKSKAEVMVQYRLSEDNYIEIRDEFVRVLEEYLAMLTQKKQNDGERNFDLENIHECAIIFGADQLRILVERIEADNNIARQGKTDDLELNQALLSEINNVMKALSR